MYYTIYKVTNKVSGKFYIGSHKTTDLDDNYMGSGKYLNHSINKHGLDNFQKEILHVFDNPEDMYAKEGKIVNEDFLAEENTYNLKVGGFGGWDYCNSKQDSEWKSYISNKSKRFTGKTFSVESRKKISDGNKGKPSSYGMLGKTHTSETKEKIGATNAKHQAGTKNSQFGTMWITNEHENKKIKKTDSIPEGWRKGRIIGR